MVSGASTHPSSQSRNGACHKAGRNAAALYHEATLRIGKWLLGVNRLVGTVMVAVGFWRAKRGHHHRRIEPRHTIERRRDGVQESRDFPRDFPRLF